MAVKRLRAGSYTGIALALPSPPDTEDNLDLVFPELSWFTAG